jgi:hypothetical protein
LPSELRVHGDRRRRRRRDRAQAEGRWGGEIILRVEGTQDWLPTVDAWVRREARYVTLYTPKCVEGLFSEVGLKVELFCGYLVRVPVHDLPAALFGAKDHRGPKIVWSKFSPSAEFAFEPL